MVTLYFEVHIYIPEVVGKQEVGFPQRIRYKLGLLSNATLTGFCCIVAMLGFSASRSIKGLTNDVVASAS